MKYIIEYNAGNRKNWIWISSGCYCYNSDWGGASFSKEFAAKMSLICARKQIKYIKSSNISEFYPKLKILNST